MIIFNPKKQGAKEKKREEQKTEFKSALSI